jgi:hypothetical protein
MAVLTADLEKERRASRHGSAARLQAGLEAELADDSGEYSFRHPGESRDP